MTRKQNLLFLQLPSLDNDVHGPHENIPLAGIYLAYALETSRARSRFDACFLPPESDGWDNATLVREITALRPAVIACTLYLWNVERTLRVLRQVRQSLPETTILAGGPEAAAEHPLLFRSRVPDVVAVGEGEGVFPGILEALAQGETTDFAGVAWRRGRRYAWGRRAAPPVDLLRSAPPADYARLRPDPRGMAYIETARGCPLRCSFCRYHHLRRTMNFVPPADVARRVALFAERGAREFKFTDPTFNSHPQFEDVLRRIIEVNPGRRLAFFAELRADRLTDEVADLLAAANFTEIEVGLQSTDPQVLKTIRRPGAVAQVQRGVGRLAERGIKVTLDVMYGLPLQTPQDVYRSIEWGLGRANVTVQGLQTLLLPGTDLRRDARQWRMSSSPLPPYGVYGTATMSRGEMRAIEEYISRTPALPSDSPAERYAGRRLPDLFEERMRVSVEEPLPASGVPGTRNRRAVLLAGRDLYGRRDRIRGILRQAAAQDPDMLWQFVLCPEAEEPLDLIDDMAAELRRQPAHLLDRYANARLTGRRSARRVFLQFKPRGRFDGDWVAAADELLERLFY